MLVRAGFAAESHHIVIHSGALGLSCGLPSCGASTSKKHCCPEHLGQTPRPPLLTYFMVRQFEKRSWIRFPTEASLAFLS